MFDNLSLLATRSAPQRETDCPPVANSYGTHETGVPSRPGSRKTREYLPAVGPRTSGPRLEITAWTHHDTAWMALTGPLVAATSATLRAMLCRVRRRVRHGTVLELCGLIDLDSAGTYCIIDEQHHLLRLGRRLEVVAA